MAAGDVEISTLVPEGEWTQESLADLVRGYERKIAEMGARPGEIKSHVDHTARGGVKIRVVWEKDDAPRAPQTAQRHDAPAAASGGVDAQHGKEPAAG
jgi:hypothetical protein